MRICIEHLTKRYQQGHLGLDDISLTMGPGVLGLLGPNGAGKSTLMRILATITKPTQGHVLWNDRNIVESPSELRAVLGYLPQDFGVYPNLNAIEFLSYLGALKGLAAKSTHRRIDELLTLLNLTEVSKRALGTYSSGMRQRVGIAQALLNDPRILIVDEPTVGLDPQERVRFRNLLSDLSGERIVILSTHIVSDIETAATNIVIINRGKLLKYGSLEDLLHTVEGRVWEVVVNHSALPQFRERYLVSNTLRRTDGVYARVVSDTPPEMDRVRPLPPSLEDAYLHILRERATLSSSQRNLERDAH